jgi:hypothetical protein
MQAQVIPIESKRLTRVQRSALFQHLSAGVVLAEAGYDALRKHPGEDLALSWFSLIAGAVLVIAVVLEIRHLRQHRAAAKAGHAEAHGSAAPAGGGGGISWMDVIAVPALIAEGWHKAHRGAHYLPYVYFGLAAFTLLRATVLDRLIGSPRAVIDGERVVVRHSLFRSRSVSWADVVTLTSVAKGVELQLANGRRTLLPLDDAMNRQTVEHAIVSAWTAIEATRVPPAPAADTTASVTSATTTAAAAVISPAP